MPIVNMPDGQAVSFPDDMPKEQIRDLIATKYPEVVQGQNAQSVSQGDAFRASFASGVPLGKTAMAGVAGLYGGLMSEDLTVPEAYAQARQELGTERELGKEQWSKTSALGTGSGVIGSALTLPTKALQAPTMITRALKGGLAAIPYGAGYAADKADSLKEGASLAVQSIPSSFAFGGAGSAATDLALRGGRVAYEKTAKPLTSRALQYLDKVKSKQQPKVDINIAGAQKAGVHAPISPEDLSQSPIRLSAGDLSQDAVQQSLEVNALSRVYGDDAQKLAQKAKEVQAGSARDFIEGQADAGLSPTSGFEAAERIKDRLSTAYKSAKVKTRAAYKEVGELQQDKPLQVGARFIKETIVPDLQDWARKGGSGTGFDLNAKGMAEAKRLYNQGVAVSKMDKINSVNFNKMEQWRGRVSQALRDAKANLPVGVQGNSETTFLSGMLQRFDDTFNNLPVEAIRNGDDAIIEALAKARNARSNQGTLFEKNKIIMDVLKNNEVTNETLAHSIFTSGGNNAKQRATNFKKIYEATGKNPEILQSFKEGVYANILKDSLGVEVDATGRALVDFAKLSKSLGKFVDDNPTLFNMIHPDNAEKEVVKQALEAARRIRSKKVGVVNYSNSAYKMIDFLDSISPTAAGMKVPLTDLSAKGLLKDMAEDSAKRQLESNLSDVLQLKLDGMNKDFYNFFERFAPKASPVVGGKLSAEQGVSE